jgi:hypothetical protein
VSEIVKFADKVAGLTAVIMITGVIPIWAHEPHMCPGWINDTPALPGHLNQADLLKRPFEAVF